MRPVATLLALILAVSFGCVGTSGAGAGEGPELADKFNDLREAIRALPGVQLDGDDAYLRGAASSFTADTQLKFASRGHVLGNLAQVEPLFPIRDIRRLRVLSGAEASSAYGLIGSNGVVEIFVKE